MKRTWICLAGLAAALAGCAAPTGYSSGGAGTDEPNVYVAREAFGVDRRPPVAQALLAAGDVEQAPVRAHVPVPAQAGLGERAVERDAVSVALGLGERAVDVEDDRRDAAVRTEGGGVTHGVSCQ